MTHSLLETTTISSNNMPNSIVKVSSQKKSSEKDLTKKFAP